VGWIKAIIVEGRDPVVGKIDKCEQQLFIRSKILLLYEANFESTVLEPRQPPGYFVTWELITGEIENDPARLQRLVQQRLDDEVHLSDAWRKTRETDDQILRDAGVPKAKPPSHSSDCELCQAVSQPVSGECPLDQFPEFGAQHRLKLTSLTNRWQG